MAKITFEHRWGHSWKNWLQRLIEATESRDLDIEADKKRVGLGYLEKAVKELAEPEESKTLDAVGARR